MVNSDPERKTSVNVDLSYLMEVSGNDPSFVREMIESYLDNTPGFIEDMKRLSGEQNWVEIGNIAHKMKPSVGFMGLFTLKDIVQQLETSGKAEQNISEIPGLIEEIDRVNKVALEILRDKLREDFD